MRPEAIPFVWVVEGSQTVAAIGGHGVDAMATLRTLVLYWVIAACCSSASLAAEIRTVSRGYASLFVDLAQIQSAGLSIIPIEGSAAFAPPAEIRFAGSVASTLGLVGKLAIRWRFRRPTAATGGDSYGKWLSRQSQALSIESGLFRRAARRVGIVDGESRHEGDVFLQTASGLATLSGPTQRLIQTRTQFPGTDWARIVLQGQREGLIGSIFNAIHLGLFKPGPPPSHAAPTLGPGKVTDCNGNLIFDECDVDCGPQGGRCDVVDCGASQDCNSNMIPDECEVDCNTNNVPDECDIAAGTSLDGNKNGVPDECEQTLWAARAPDTPLAAVRVATGLATPVFVGAPPGDLARLFIVEQGGTIRILDLDSGTVLSTPFLDLSGLVSTIGEQGLLSMAFSPSYDLDGFFYVNYTNLASDTVIARFSVSADPNIAIAGSAVVVKTIAQDFINHNGGQLQFGPDLLLYVGMGDGGDHNDPNNRAQDLGSLLGKMLRLDVNAPPDYIPVDNPFVGVGGARPEIWSSGLRNPWRFSFDRLTGDMYIGDVGEADFEEIDFQPFDSPGGENYGWRCMEAFACTDAPGCKAPEPAGAATSTTACNEAAFTPPIVDVPHGAGVCSVTGGYVYRGGQIPDLGGTYFYADFCASWIRSFRYKDGNLSDVANRTAELTPSEGPILAPVSFGEDGAGELYIVSYLGSVYKIVPAEGLYDCGNGQNEPGEECDDGNTASGDGCDGNCRFENGSDTCTCAAATPICPGTPAAGGMPGSTSSASPDGSASCGGSDNTPDVWYWYLPGKSGILTVETCGFSDFDTVVSVHTTCPGTVLNELGCNDDGPTSNCPAGRSRLNVLVTAEVPLFIRVSGSDGATGNFELTLTGPDCPAFPLTCFPDCNDNGIDDALDIAMGTSADCNVNDVPDECDIAGDQALDCAGGPVGSIDGGAAIFSSSPAGGTPCFACHNTDGSGGPGFLAPNIRNHSRVEIWNVLLPPTTHLGGTYPDFTHQDFADLEAFLADAGSRGRPDEILDECQNKTPAAGGTLDDCDADQVSDGCELESGTQVDANYDGLPDECFPPLCSAAAVAAVGSRYLSATPAAGTGRVALRVRGDPGDADVLCVDRFVQADGTLMAEPVFKTPAMWGTISFTGVETLPGTTYHVEVDCRGTSSDSAAVTTWMWADTNNRGVVDIDDVLCLLAGFANDFTVCPFTTVNLWPCLPDDVVDLDDILVTLYAFAGAEYPCPPPCGP